MTESEVKQVFLPFLRQFYRYRYEYSPDTEQSSLDNISADGLVADGMLTFRREDGSTFVSTYEATSRDKIEEVKYSINQTYFLWDSVAFGAAMAALVYAATYVFRVEALRALSMPGKIGMPIGVALIGFFMWYFTMRYWRKYRYVYAVEQFKRYGADEQWVAIAEDVFPAPTDPYFLELKDQCIYHGFGLAIVHADKQVRVVAAPSRLGVFGEDRKFRHWLTQNDWYQAMASRAKAAAQYQPPGMRIKLGRTIMRPINQFVLDPIKNAFGKRLGSPATEAYQRFTGEYLIQKWVCTIALVIVCLFTYRAAQFRTEKIATGPADVFRPAEQKELPPSPERQNQYVIADDESPIPYGTAYRSDDYNGVPRQDPRQKPTAEDLRSDADALPVESKGSVSGARSNISTLQKNNSTVSPKPAVTTKSGTTSPTVGGGCAGIKSAGGWIVQDNVFSTAAFASDRVKALRKAGIQADAFEGSCIGESKWIVRLGYNQYTVAAARAKAADYEALIGKANLRTGKVIIRKVP
jgi:hypothetical protein